MKKCPFCAEEIKDEAIKCKHCGEMIAEVKANTKISTEEYQQEPLLKKKMPDNNLGVGCVALVVIILLFQYFSNQMSPANTTSTGKSTSYTYPTAVPTAKLTNDEIKKKSYPIDYQQLLKNPEKYKGEWHYFKGKILQIMESGSGSFATTEIRLGVTNKGYGIYDDVVYITYKGETSFVVDNMIHAWGKTTGSYCYTSQAGWEICVPGLDGELLQKV